jgi:hypothetical protein
VFLRVASLKVYMPEVVAGSKAQSLTREHLKWILNQVRLRGCRRWVTVGGIVDCDPIDYYAPGTPGPLVLTDSIANHACRTLDATNTLAQWQGVLNSVSRLQARLIQSGKPPLSHLAANGWPQDAIKAARCGDAAPARPDEELARWATDQADAWIHELRGQE